MLRYAHARAASGFHLGTSTKPARSVPRQPSEPAGWPARSHGGTRRWASGRSRWWGNERQSTGSARTRQVRDEWVRGKREGGGSRGHGGAEGRRAVEQGKGGAARRVRCGERGRDRGGGDRDRGTAGLRGPTVEFTGDGLSVARERSGG